MPWDHQYHLWFYLSANFLSQLQIMTSSDEMSTSYKLISRNGAILTQIRKKTWFLCKNGYFDANNVTSGYTKLVVFNELLIYITGWRIGLILWPIQPKCKRYLAEICDLQLICAKKGWFDAIWRMWDFNAKKPKFSIVTYIIEHCLSQLIMHSLLVITSHHFCYGNWKFSPVQILTYWRKSR